MKTNLYEDIPDNAPRELFSELLKSDGVRVERIVSYGQGSPDGFWYDQDENEWVVLLEGSATLVFENKPEISMKPGDYIHIPAKTPHRVEKTDPNGRSVWLAVFYPPSD